MLYCFAGSVWSRLFFRIFFWIVLIAFLRVDMLSSVAWLCCPAGVMPVGGRLVDALACSADEGRDGPR